MQTKQFRGLGRVGALSLLLTGLNVGAISPPAARAEDPRTISLVDQRGATFRLTDLRGRYTVLTFVATRCTDACPIANAAFATLARHFRHARADVRLLTVTLDPDYDTPFVMAHAAQAFAAAPPEWTFASGRPAAVRRLMRSFGVIAERDASGVPDLHGSFVYVLDARVRLARTLLLSSGLTKDVDGALASRSLAHRRPAAPV